MYFFFQTILSSLGRKVRKLASHNASITVKPERGGGGDRPSHGIFHREVCPRVEILILSDQGLKDI